MLGLDQPYDLDADVALRPEPFGALAYHHGTRRLVFLKSAALVATVHALRETTSLGEALRRAEVPEAQWPGIVAAVTSLEESGMVHPRTEVARAV